MAETFKRPSVTIGVDKYTFFKVLTDTESETTYDEAVTLPGTVEIAPTDEGDAEPFDADNGAYETLAYVGNIGHEITNADIPPAVDAMWRGLEVDEYGGVKMGGDVKDVYFGVAWRTLHNDGTYRYFRCYKGRYGFASKVGAQTKPSNGAPEPSTAQATYSAVKRTSDDAYYYYLDDDKLTLEKKKEIAEKWFTDMSYTPAAE